MHLVNTNLPASKKSHRLQACCFLQVFVIIIVVVILLVTVAIFHSSLSSGDHSNSKDLLAKAVQYTILYYPYTESPHSFNSEEIL